jgi:hypothetical protein
MSLTCTALTLRVVSARPSTEEREAPTHHINDISGNAGKAKQFLPFLQRAGKSVALVEFVMSGHRLKLTIPKEVGPARYLSPRSSDVIVHKGWNACQ